MDDLTVRLLVVGGAVLVAAVGALATRRWQRPSHPAVDIAGLGLPDGIVVFTSTDCGNCAETRSRVAATGAPVREVTWELESAMIERAGVTAVPLTLVVEDGVVLDQIVGIPSRRRLRRTAPGR